MDKRFIDMISIDGGLKQVPSYLKDDLVAKGWKVVINPKRTYYPEMDQTHPMYKKENIGDLVDDSDVLRVEQL